MGKRTSEHPTPAQIACAERGAKVKASRILRFNEVKNRVGLGRTSIYAGVAAGTFPPPIPLSERAVGWLEAEIENWIAARVAAARAPEASPIHVRAHQAPQSREGA